ncbi:acyl carrier protein [bacterium]|nr:acyl carrier protein [bacterium]
MERNVVIEKVNEFLVEEFEVEEELIEPEGNLQETLDLDSLDYVDLVVVIESTFGFKVQPDDFREIVTFTNFYDYILEKVRNPQVK